ncbi:SMC5-SMC6 complex localization factor protein 1-like [Saccostrea echinata]|uniref:SMC5-SMC6 complex localization factor protein 1-like n=1 Tax=Saccostrea echinata TaxID=191078 RepID=UPI002A82515A|nr:SMC5-SMC6 complex localization factor protein 1-like [Saccostrea echinata]
MADTSPQTRLQKSLVSRRQFLLSGLEESEKRELAEKIFRLGGVFLESENFKPACTHLVCGRLSRSEKFLCACAMGIWVLHPRYITDSAEKGEWLREEDFEWVNFSSGVSLEMANAARRWRFNVEAFRSFPFSGWKAAVIVRGSRKSSIYARLLSCGGAEVYKLSLPVGNRSRVANILTYVFVGERNFQDALHLIEYGILCLRPEFIGDYILQDPPPDPLDYLVKAVSSPCKRELCNVDMDNSLMDIQLSQSTSLQSTPSSQLLGSLDTVSRGSESNTPQGSLSNTPQKLSNKDPQNNRVLNSPFLPADFSMRVDAPCTSSAPDQSQRKSKDLDRKRKMTDDLDHAVQQLKRVKVAHQGDLWHSSVFTGLSMEDKQKVEVASPFSESLAGMIMACFEEESNDLDFFLSGLDLVRSSISERQFPTVNIIKTLVRGLLKDRGPNSSQTELIQYRCYNVLMKILSLHPPTNHMTIELYRAAYTDTQDTTQTQGTVFRSFLRRWSETDNATFPKGHVLLLRFIVAAMEVNLQHYLDRIEKGELNIRKLRGCMYAQILWPGNTLISFNTMCKDFVVLFGLCITEEMDDLTKRDLIKLTTSLICMAVLIAQYVETGQRVNLQEPIVPSHTAASLLHEAVRQVPGTLRIDLLRTILRNLSPSWIAVHFCCLLLRNLDDYLLLQDLPAEGISLKEIVTKYFFLLPKLNSNQSNLMQSSHQKRSASRLQQEANTRTRRSLLKGRDKENERLDDKVSSMSAGKNVNKKNVKGETPLQVACIKNDLKKVRQLLKVPGVDINTSDNAGWSPLHEACNFGHVEIVKELLNFVPAKTMDHFFSPGGDKKCKKVNLLAVTDDLITPLHDAVMNNRLDVCKLLLQHGGPAMLECKTALNQTPLDLATTSQMKELLLSFTEDRSARSSSQGSVSSDCPADSPPSDYLYEQVLGGEDRGFADREECAKYIAMITTLIHSYLKVMDYDRILALMNRKLNLSCKSDICNGISEKAIKQYNGTEACSKKINSHLQNENRSTPRKSMKDVGVLQFHQDFRTAFKLSVYIERFAGHILKITEDKDFESLRFDLGLLKQIAFSCKVLAH